ncbi:SMP-30/gluconolactonase/LRE family protein [Confluentibacter citreus]|uniref:SMP-30/gluconolactonase/LRE family protein n=1 Tax=Confluentibacter citreus TaxID=2007307 RepID=UPI000C2914F7|nr:SMP-30/gluconolactonase/LRE family protein [Confluentibacter citreus]
MTKLKFTILIASSLLLNCFSQSEKKESIIATNATLELVTSDYEFAFTEGPIADKKGRVYFTDQPKNKIYIWDEKKGVSLYTEDAKRANGLFFNAKWELFACAEENNQIGYFDKNKNFHVVFENYDGKHLNGPNDLWIAPNQGIYFTDPYWQRPFWSKDHKEIQDTKGVYYINPKGETIRIINDYRIPNGIIGTPDGKTLYVADMGARETFRYDIQPDGSITNKTPFVKYGSDGMTIDNEGNVYLTTSNKVMVFNPQGELLEEITVPEAPTNVCFGGKKRNILFITSRTTNYTLKMNVKGVDKV